MFDFFSRRGRKNERKKGRKIVWKERESSLTLLDPKICNLIMRNDIKKYHCFRLYFPKKYYLINRWLNLIL